MKNTKILLLPLLLILSFYSFSQKSDFYDYKWLSKKIPIDTLITYDADTIIPFTSDTKYVISFWYVNCPPCIAEIKWLNKLKEDFSHEKVEFIAISFNDKNEVEQLLKRKPFNYLQCFLSMDVINRDRLTFGYPTNLIVDEEGIVLFQKSGGHSNEDEAEVVYDILSAELNNLIIK